MSTFETSATVGEQGQLQLEGIPFVPGTKVIVQVSEAISADVAEAETSAARRARLEELFRTTKGFRQTPKISREELYDRKCLH